MRVRSLQDYAKDRATSLAAAQPSLEPVAR
jgi:hypothetical protein